MYTAAKRRGQLAMQPENGARDPYIAPGWGAQPGFQGCAKGLRGWGHADLRREGVPQNRGRCRKGPSLGPSQPTPFG